MYRARACPPAQALAQNGAEPAPSCVSILAWSMTASSVRCKAISGTRVGRTRRSPSVSPAREAMNGLSDVLVDVGTEWSLRPWPLDSWLFLETAVSDLAARKWSANVNDAGRGCVSPETPRSQKETPGGSQAIE